MTWRDRGILVLLAAAPSSLMLGVTAHLSTDVASAPFLWVIPLALYLLTFVIAFQNKPWIPLPITLVIQAALGAVCVLIVAFRSARWGLAFSVHLVAFFFAALMCHQLLAARRPAPDRLTEFYLLMSLGGVVGGGDHDPSRAGELLQKRETGRRGIHDHQTSRQAGEQRGPLTGLQVRPDEIEFRVGAVDGARVDRGSAALGGDERVGPRAEDDGDESEGARGGVVAAALAGRAHEVIAAERVDTYRVVRDDDVRALRSGDLTPGRPDDGRRLPLTCLARCGGRAYRREQNSG
jgi:hypothetical protein